ncbi:hypothetical protein QTN25_000939 [Entamoeba marina]
MRAVGPHLLNDNVPEKLNLMLNKLNNCNFDQVASKIDVLVDENKQLRKENNEMKSGFERFQNNVGEQFNCVKHSLNVLTNTISNQQTNFKTIVDGLTQLHSQINAFDGCFLSKRIKTEPQPEPRLPERQPFVPSPLTNQNDGITQFTNENHNFPMSSRVNGNENQLDHHSQQPPLTFIENPNEMLQESCSASLSEVSAIPYQSQPIQTKLRNEQPASQYNSSFLNTEIINKLLYGESETNEGKETRNASKGKETSCNSNQINRDKILENEKPKTIDTLIRIKPNLQWYCNDNQILNSFNTYGIKESLFQCLSKWTNQSLFNLVFDSNQCRIGLNCINQFLPYNNEQYEHLTVIITTNNGLIFGVTHKRINQLQFKGFLEDENSFMFIQDSTMIEPIQIQRTYGKLSVFGQTNPLEQSDFFIGNKPSLYMIESAFTLSLKQSDIYGYFDGNFRNYYQSTNQHYKDIEMITTNEEFHVLRLLVLRH